MKKYRMRYTPRSTMNRVKIREQALKGYRVSRNRRMAYPLFESWANIYNYANIRSALQNWDMYSSDETSNMIKAATLLEYVNEYHEFNQEKRDATKLFLEIMDSIANINNHRKYLCNMKVDEDCKEAIINQLKSINESDRVLRNYHRLNKRFNTTKSIIESYHWWDMDETVYRLCEMTDSYHITDPVSRFIIMAENALLSISENLDDDDITTDSVLKRIIGYTLIHREDTSVEECLDTISTAIKKSYFLEDDACSDYIDKLRLLENGTTIRDTIDDRIQIIEAMDPYHHVSKAIDGVKSISNTVSNIFDKIRLAPANAAAMAKSAIHSILVPTRLEDIEKGTHNALSIAFYACITIGGFSLGVIPGVLATISSILTSKHMDKQYLKSAISEWKDHKRAIARRIETSKDEDQKRRLNVYMDEVEKNIDLLETEWESKRDKTAEEMREKDDSQRTTNPSSWKTDVDPRGKYTPSTHLGIKNAVPKYEPDDDDDDY